MVGSTAPQSPRRVAKLFSQALSVRSLSTLKSFLMPNRRISPLGWVQPSHKRL